MAVSEEPAVDPTQPSRRERIPHALPAGLSAEGLGLRASASTGQIALCLRSPSPRSEVLAALQPRFDIAADALAPTLSFAEVRRRMREGFRGWAASPSPSLAGRLVRHRGRELVVEITIDHPVDWQPGYVEVIWADGTRLTATVDVRRTTRSGRVAAGRLVRLALRLDADGPPDAPAAIEVTGASAPLTVTLAAR